MWLARIIHLPIKNKALRFKFHEHFVSVVVDSLSTNLDRVNSVRNQLAKFAFYRVFVVDIFISLQIQIVTSTLMHLIRVFSAAIIIVTDSHFRYVKALKKMRNLKCFPARFIGSFSARTPITSHYRNNLIVWRKILKRQTFNLIEWKALSIRKWFDWWRGHMNYRKMREMKEKIDSIPK